MSENENAGKGQESRGLAETVEEVNDRLAEALGHAQTTASHGEIRPSTMVAFDKLQEAHELLCLIDPTRETPDTENTDSDTP